MVQFASYLKTRPIFSRIKGPNDIAIYSVGHLHDEAILLQLLESLSLLFSCAN